jgi:hypothetical protein
VGVQKVLGCGPGRNTLKNWMSTPLSFSRSPKKMLSNVRVNTPHYYWGREREREKKRSRLLSHIRK